MPIKYSNIINSNISSSISTINSNISTIQNNISSLQTSVNNISLTHISVTGLTTGQVLYYNGANIVGKKLDISTDLSYNSLTDGQYPIKSGTTLIGKTPQSNYSNYMNSKIYTQD